MAYSTREPRVHLEIGSRLENVELVQIAVEASLQQLAVEEAISNQIGTAVREAVANAIKHGNQSDADKQVKVDFGLQGDEVVIEVRDEGLGFDPDRIPNPLEPRFFAALGVENGIWRVLIGWAKTRMGIHAIFCACS